MMISQNKQHVWHPFTQMKTAAAPIEIVSAKDCTLYTADGNAILDAISSWWVTLHGHGHPAIAAAIAAQAQQLEQVIFAGFTHQPAQLLAQSLIEIWQGWYDKVFFSDDGSTSVEVALKMAIQFWHNQGITHRKRIIAFHNAYHGDTFGSMSIAARNAFNAAFSSYLFEVSHIDVPTDENIASVLQQMEAILAQGDTGAFIFEPLVQGAAGMVMYAPEHLNRLMELAQQHQVICIADEVMTGFGRTGKLFATQYLATPADIICLSKGITGGFLPLGVTLCTEKIYAAFHADDKLKTFFHGHSYTANPLACAAANASLKILLQDECNDRIAAISSAHQAFLAILKNYPQVKQARCLGTLLAFEFATAETNSYFNPIGERIHQFFMANGIFIRPLGNTVYLMPPYCITASELQFIYQNIVALLESNW